jgi:hypothetical protein
MFSLVFFAAIYGAGAAVMLKGLHKAPQGFQDDEGFHTTSVE